MTNREPEPAILGLMKGILIALLLLSTLVRAEEPALRDLLRDALYAEEVVRDPETAARQYRELLDRHEQDRALAASALFRLAEVRRKQDRNDEAIALFQQLLARYPEAGPEAKLARENLAALGVKDISTPDAPPVDHETRDLQRLRQLAETSPDRLGDWDHFHSAIQLNHLTILSFLLDEAAPAAKSHDLLAIAAQNGSLSATFLLLKKGIDPNSPGNSNALGIAAKLGHRYIVKALIEAGADINALPSKCDVYVPNATDKTRRIGTPLMEAFALGDKDLIELFPTDKADVAIKARGTGTTVLHIAAARNDTVLVERLLDLGADPNATCHIVMKPGPGISLHGASPLDFALLNGANDAARILAQHGGKIANPEPLIAAVAEQDVEKTSLLLKYGADPNVSTSSPSGKFPLILSASPEIALLLLEHGADPNIETESSGPLLSHAIGKGEELVRILLEAGADPNPPCEPTISPLYVASLGGTAPIVSLLLEKGAKADETWIERRFEYAAAENRPLLFRRFLYPALMEKPAITMVFPETTKRDDQFHELATREGDAPPRTLEWLLLQHQQQWPLPDGSSWPSRMNLWRKTAGESVENITVRIGGPDPLPELKWGDVIELTVGWEAIGKKPRFPDSISYTNKLPPEIAWSLRKRISFPVTVKIDGREREITLRGDRLVFDPSTSEVPLTGARELMNLLWQSETGTMPRLLLDRAEILVQREDWPEIRLPLSSGGKDFPLAAGDRLKLSISGPSAETLLGIRKTRISVIGKDYPFSRHFGHRDLAQRLVPASVPTLIQALAETFHTHGLGNAPADPAALPPWFLGQYITVISFPHRPDFSRIRIRRLQEDGSEKTIDVNLADIVSASSDATTVEEARAADIPLQGGDIVELPVLPENADQPWRGLSAGEAAFFAKALDCRVQVTGGDGEVTFAGISYRPPRFVETEAGLVPLHPESGTSSPTAAALDDSGRDVHVIRGEYPEAELRAAYIFLRDGDRLKLRPRPRVGQQPQLQRPHPPVQLPPPQPQPVLPRNAPGR